ncbi:MAG: DUF4445 domain-containing protein [Firmicutes bacterium]|nr:DUF4445 domain-containing protein [Bacillota bacterium]
MSSDKINANECTITFLPDNIKVTVGEGLNLLEAARLAGIEIQSACGGNGACGRCAVIVRSGLVDCPVAARVSGGGDEGEGGHLRVLACQAVVRGDVVVEIPPASRLAGPGEHQIQVLDARGACRPVQDLAQDLTPVFRRIRVKVPEPSLGENASDLSRLYLAIQAAEFKEGARLLHTGLGVLRSLPDVLRNSNWEVTVSLAEMINGFEIAEVLPGAAAAGEPYYGLAVDIGTTTVVTHLIDLSTGRTVDVRGTYNRQVRYGEDVISRIIYADEHGSGEHGAGLRELQGAVVGTINELIAQAVAERGVAPDAIRAMACAGNTTMTHLFLGIVPRYIRLEPYVPAASFVPPVRAGELGLEMHPGALVYCLPGIASYVGGDITSGVLATGIGNSGEIQLLVDIGTNGEMVLGNRDWLLACACSAGPAFEGAGVKFGMRAVRGAIERVEIDPETGEVRCGVIGGVRPLGICGSGLVDCLASLRRAGVIERNGAFNMACNMAYGTAYGAREGKRHTRQRGQRVRRGDEGPEFVLAWGEDSGNSEDIVITESDVKNLIRSKAAIYAGIRVLLKMVGMDLEDISRILIAGGFGNYLDVDRAISIGLLPDLPRERYVYVGNASVKGAELYLLSRKARREAEAIARRMTYLELSAGNDFMDEFVSGLFIPHTDLSLFPTVNDRERMIL